MLSEAEFDAIERAQKGLSAYFYPGGPDQAQKHAIRLFAEYKEQTNRAEAAEQEVARLKTWSDGCEMERLGVAGKVCLTRGLRYVEEARHAD